VPKDFRKGTLRIEGDVTLDGKRISLVRESHTERVEAHTLKVPLEGQWSWFNRLGDPVFRNHAHDIGSRNSYDVSLLKDVG
jgi:hypothetical protein